MEKVLVNRPVATVGGLIIAQDGDILLVRSKKWIDCWTLPGGKIEPGETSAQAFVREVKEETGLSLANVRFALVIDSIYNPQFWEKRHFVMNQFVGTLAPGIRKEDVKLNSEADTFQWIDPKIAYKLPLNEETYRLLDWYFAHMASWGYIGFEHHKIHCVIGDRPEERKQKQDIFIDLKVEADFTKCAASGLLKDTIDYVELANLCTKLASSRCYRLIENMACDVLENLFKEFPIRWASIRIKKPEALTSAAYTVVELEKYR